jgi:hypothetical protein
LLEIESPYLAVFHLQAMYVLLLRENAEVIEEIADFAEKSLALGGGHEPQSEGRNHGVHVIVAVAMNFEAKCFRTGVDDFQARIRNVGLQITRKARIDFESKQRGFERDHF